MSNITKDLALFNELVDVLITEEAAHPVAERIEANTLYDVLDLSLNTDKMIDDEFKVVLREVLVSTPKTATNYFLINFLEEDKAKPFLEIYWQYC